MFGNVPVFSTVHIQCCGFTPTCKGYGALRVQINKLVITSNLVRQAERVVLYKSVLGYSTIPIM